ncbi:CD225/dispanin family protein [Actinomadura sp. 7K507]|uniref:CD225/dispanin family protein n=1 Tax=Actinomadura sp. 7K507 TaxID=2530365 RepID=UPI001052F6F7|nr:CD225/dispanin family protein [Actinomadura sp. 7K507]TDC76862.1 CD225/dispanin family protein [Actinomadura sp. 7K507]
MAYPPAPPPPNAYGAGNPPPNHLVWSILTTIFCCLPAGIVSIVFAAQVNGKWKAGDQAGAMKASSNAKTWAIVSAIAGVVVGVISFVVQLSMAS